jgi:hypothetical protein
MAGLAGLEATHMSPEYRAYTIGDDDHIQAFEPIVCDDDEQAIKAAQQLVNGHDIELWTGPRLVFRLPKLKKV